MKKHNTMLSTKSLFYRKFCHNNPNKSTDETISKLNKNTFCKQQKCGESTFQADEAMNKLKKQN